MFPTFTTDGFTDIKANSYEKPAVNHEYIFVSHSRLLKNMGTSMAERELLNFLAWILPPLMSVHKPRRRNLNQTPL